MTSDQLNFVTGMALGWWFFFCWVPYVKSLEDKLRKWLEKKKQ